jgi:hypothetical protein
MWWWRGRREGRAEGKNEEERGEAKMRRRGGGAKPFLHHRFSCMCVHLFSTAKNPSGRQKKNEVTVNRQIRFGTPLWLKWPVHVLGGRFV